MRGRCPSFRDRPPQRTPKPVLRVVADTEAVQRRAGVHVHEAVAVGEAVGVNLVVASLHINDDLPADVLRVFYLLPDRLLLQVPSAPVYLLAAESDVWHIMRPFRCGSGPGTANSPGP